MGALLTALPTTLSNCCITHVLASKSTAAGLQRATTHYPSIPASHFSLVTYKKRTGKTRDEYDLALAKKIRQTKPDLVVLAGWMLILSSGFLEALRRDWTEEQVDQQDEKEEDEDEGEGEREMKSLRTPGASPYPSTSNLLHAPIPIINLHPALPGTFPGAHAILDAYNAFNHPTSGPSSLSLDSLSLDPSSSSVLTPPPPIPRIAKTGIMIHRVIPLLDAGEPVVVREIELRQGESLEELEERIHVVEWEAIVDAVRIVVGQLGDGTWWKEEGEEEEVVISK